MFAKKDKTQVNEKICNLEREYRDCIYKKQKRQDWDHKAYQEHQVLYIVHLPNEDGDMHII